MEWRRFRRNFRDQGWVRVPTVYWRYTTPVVLTLEYLPGTKISDTARLRAADLDTELLARRATECYLIQILKHGFLHADCHPGNIAVDPSGAHCPRHFAVSCRVDLTLLVCKVVWV